ncbi:tetratricopeptide repeat protein [Marinilabilia salmonicolor]|uniref:Tetratricopeptide repeat protein n=1 Tax=Marinilabilia salmonicolor TaxID=989 RepID=A0A2T0XES0_9BACT|nr:hypothetical protein [Marinilabilia salmonicolor]PRY97411.1 hypothetical protein BY457_11295 [Marinilabilia salmonicolor]RCW35360.1 hypothetical protein DFO77_110127 [Marinilabilia salmonicolor]
MKFCSFCTLLLVVTFWSCQTPFQREAKRTLVAIDSLIYEDYEVANDSLRDIDVFQLNLKNRGYYYLLSTILKSRLDESFVSDSAISVAVESFRSPLPNNNIARALIYQGIVRYKIPNIPDSLVFTSLKEVEPMVDAFPGLLRLEEETKLWFFLGILHYNNNNFQQAEKYLDMALRKAEQMEDVSAVVITSLAVFWRYMSIGNREKAKGVLDKLENVEGISFEDQYDIINARAAFYYYYKDYENALKEYKILEEQMSEVKLKPRLSNIYYSISRIYSGLGKRDSSLYYAKKSVEHFPDSLGEWQDYYLFVNLGSEASKVGDYELAAAQYKDAVDFLVDKSGERSEKKILELEKQYDLSEARVETLRQKQKFQRFAFIAGAGFVLLVFIVLIYFLNLRKSRVEYENERLMRISAEKEVAGKVREGFQRRHLLRFYQLITQREMVAQQRFDMLSQKYIRSDSSAYKELQTELNALKEEFSGMMYDLMNDDLFYSNVDVPSGFPLSNTEKVVLFLLKFEIPSVEIATVLGITNNNLRVRKSNLKKRILENLSDYPSLNNLLALFN